MSENTDTNTDPVQEPVAEPSASDDLDALLSEYQEPEKQPQAQPEQSAVSTDEVTEFRQMMAEQRTEKLNAGLNEAAQLVKTAAGETATNIPDWMLVGALREESTRNPNLEKVFNERVTNPDAWNKVAAALGKKIANDLTPTDKQATDSWDAVTSATHAASHSQPVPESLPNFDAMTDLEFQTWKMKHG